MSSEKKARRAEMKERRKILNFIGQANVTN